MNTHSKSVGVSRNNFKSNCIMDEKNDKDASLGLSRTFKRILVTVLKSDLVEHYGNIGRTVLVICATILFTIYAILTILQIVFDILIIPRDGYSLAIPTEVSGLVGLVICHAYKMDDRKCWLFICCSILPILIILFMMCYQLLLQ